MASHSMAGPSTLSPPLRSPGSYTPHSPGNSSSFPYQPFPGRSTRTPSTFSSFQNLDSPLPNVGGSGSGLPTRRTPNPHLRNTSYSTSVPASASGTSTPDYKRRARKMAQRGLIREAETDWGNVEPDEVFRRLPVNEVKRVEGKMRKEALDKQSELRAMVGTRYRDLLTSATQISTLRAASLNLSDSLQKIADTCSNPDDIAITAETSTQVSNTEDVMALLPLAAHMKLLLDAPEALYTYLGEGEVLRAGWLWLVARVVKESLAGMGEESEVYHPLLAKQWEVLQPFRAQIIQRATEKLRTRQKMPSKTLAETLLTIILLDNLPVPEALSLLLTQRKKALSEILAHSKSLTADEPMLEGKRTRADSISSIAQRERQAIGAVLSDAFQCLLETAQAAQDIFAQQSDPSGESMLEEMIRLVQKGEAKPPTITQHTPLRRASSSTHTRRASRLVSISLPFADPTSPSTNPTPPISSIRVIQSLPSSQILLQHLPPAISGFTPFITPPQSPDLTSKLEMWQADGIRMLRESAPAWLADLHSAQAVWGVRAVLADKLGQGEFEGRIRQALEDEWGARARSVWAAGLDQLVQTAKAEVDAALRDLREGRSDADSDPEKHVFSPTTFPSLPSSTLITPNPISFPTFMAGLKKRSVYRTPLLDRVLVRLEQSAKELRADVQNLPTELAAVFDGLAGESMDKVLEVLRDILAGLASESAAGTGEQVQAELFVGRVALFLARQSTFLTGMTGLPGNQAPTASALIALHSTSTVSWQAQSVSLALTSLAPLFDPLRGPAEVKATWQGPHPISPSASILLALNALVGAVRALGIPPSITDLPVVRNLVESFVDQAVQLDGWGTLQEEACVQAAVDLGFLCLIRGGSVSEDEAVKGMLQRSPETYHTSMASLLSPILAESLRRVQLILHPLLVHLDPSLRQLDTTGIPMGDGGKASSKSRSATSDTRAQLLRFGPPLGRIVAPAQDGNSGASGSAGGTATTEFRSPIAVAKPGKRFGLVSIAS